MREPAAMRMRPSVALAVVLGLGYIAMFIGLVYIFGGDVSDLSTPDAIQPFVISLAISAVVLVIVTSGLGWWAPVLRDRTRLGGPARVIPVVVFAAIAVVIVFGGGLTELTTEVLVWTAVLTSLVGFCEELAYRGLALTGARGGLNELNAWLLSTVLFGLLHLPNMLIGADVVPSIFQVFTAFMGGTMLYLVRRTTGLLVVAMVAHALWDFTAFTSQNDTLTSLLYLVTIGSLVFVIVRRREVFAESQLEGAQVA